MFIAAKKYNCHYLVGIYDNKFMSAINKHQGQGIMQYCKELVAKVHLVEPHYSSLVLTEDLPSDSSTWE
jgi:hypothetical protein